MSREAEFESVMQAEDPAGARGAGTRSGGYAVPQLLVSVRMAAEMLGVKEDCFEDHVEPRVKIVRIGRRKLIPTAELEAFIEREAYRVGGGW
jgi:hypothetical protein